MKKPLTQRREKFILALDKLFDIGLKYADKLIDLEEDKEFYNSMKNDRQARSVLDRTQTSDRFSSNIIKKTVEPTLNAAADVLGLNSNDLGLKASRTKISVMGTRRDNRLKIVANIKAPLPRSRDHSSFTGMESCYRTAMVSKLFVVFTYLFPVHQC